jgi:hypothetical protein
MNTIIKAVLNSFSAENSLEKIMVPCKVQQLLQIIIERKGFGVEDAVQYLYLSDLYKQLSKKDSYLWKMGAAYLYDLLEEEKIKKKEKQNNSAAVLLFLSFCLENYKDYKRINAEDISYLFNKYNVLDYLEDVFESLHTQGKNYIIRDIDEYINNQKI